MSLILIFGYTSYRTFIIDLNPLFLIYLIRYLLLSSCYLGVIIGFTSHLMYIFVKKIPILLLVLQNYIITVSLQWN